MWPQSFIANSAVPSQGLSLCLAVVCIAHMEVDRDGGVDRLSGPCRTPVERWRREDAVLGHSQVLYPGHLGHFASGGAGYPGMADLQMLHTVTQHTHVARYW